LAPRRLYGRGHGPRRTELREHFRATGASSVAIDPALCEILRDQTLLVLVLTSGEFEDACDLPPSELLALAATFRDAFAVLDAIGWVPEPQTETVQVTIAAGHVAQLRRLHADLGIGIFDHLDTRQKGATPEERAVAEHEIEADRVTAGGLVQILRACSGLGQC
jgi:hypothetical protein